MMELNSILDVLRFICVPIHKEGYPFIAIGVVITLICMAFLPTLGWISVFLTLGCVFFFRDPERVTPPVESIIVSPADGLIQSISSVIPPAELELGNEPLTRVSIFLSVLNVHVNRIPVTGTVIKHHYHEGAFLSAQLDKSSELNERNSFVVRTDEGADIGFVQIAGLIARRIVWHIHEGEEVSAGQRFGIIRFGSRMDVYLPKNTKTTVYKGQLSIGGETILAELIPEEPALEE